MDAIVLVIVDIVTHESPEVLLIKRYHMVEKFAATTANPALRYSILPGCLNARTFRRQPRRFQERSHMLVEFRIVIEDDIAVWVCVRERLPQLSDDPFRVRPAGDIEMKDTPPAVVNDEKAVQGAERQSRHGKEVKGYNRLAMISQERKPALAGITAPSQPSQISCHRAFRNLETELQEFTVDPWCTPFSVLQRHHADETLNLLADAWSAASS